MYPQPSSNAPFILSVTDGPTLTAAAAASCIPTANKIVLPSGFFSAGKLLRCKLSGRISCAVTTPGTARFDLRTGPSGTIIAFDTLALNLNIVAKTNVPFLLEVDLICRAIGAGTVTQLFPHGGRFQSEAVIASPLPTVGGNGSLIVPTGNPALGTGFDNTAQNVLDWFFTQTVATGSLTVTGYSVEELI